MFVCFGTLSLFWSMVVKFLILMDKIQHHSTKVCEAAVGFVPSDEQVKSIEVEPVPWKKVLLSLPFWLVSTSP